MSMVVLDQSLLAGFLLGAFARFLTVRRGGAAVVLLGAAAVAELVIVLLSIARAEDRGSQLPAGVACFAIGMIIGVLLASAEIRQRARLTATRYSTTTNDVNAGR